MIRKLGATQLRFAAISELFYEQRLSRVGKEVQKMLDDPLISGAYKTSDRWKELEAHLLHCMILKQQMELREGGQDLFRIAGKSAQVWGSRVIALSSMVFRRLRYVTKGCSELFGHEALVIQ